MTKHTPIRRFLVTALVAMTITASFPLAQKVSEAELLFREAQHKQQVERDLNGAIKLYETIAASKTADRAVKAKALLQLAGCYEIQGKQAEKVYDQIVREFKDQPAVVAQAQAKLAALRPASFPPKITKIEFGNGVRNVVATDGKRAVYWNDDRTTLYFGDVAGNTRNVVFIAEPGQRAGNVLTSPDLSKVFIGLPPGPQGFEPPRLQPAPGGPANLLGQGILKSTDGRGGREVHLFEWFTRPGPATLFFFAHWSGDGRYLLSAVLAEQDELHLAKISVDDGRVTRLPPVRGAFRAASASPDDRFIALAGPNGLSIISSQGGEPRQLIADAPGPVAWSEDGKYIVFRGPQSTSLFALPMKDGQPAGERIAIADEDDYRVSATRGGSVVLQKPMQVQPRSRQSVYLASLDDAGHLSQWKGLDIVGTFGAYPTWSADSRQFAYLALSGPVALSAPAVRVHTLDGGGDRLLFSGVRQTVMNGTVGNCLWASTRPLIYCGVFQGPADAAGGRAAGGQRGPGSFATKVISIASDTGRMEEIGSLDGVRFFQRLSPDDRTLISFVKLGPPVLRTAARQWDIGSSQEKETTFAGVVESNVSESPDGRWVYRIVAASGNRTEYQIRSTSGGDADWKSLMHVNRPAAPQEPTALPVPVQYSPDSKWILYHDKDVSGKDGLFRVSTSGGEPQRLGDYPTGNLSSLMSISPDGRHILVHVDALFPASTLDFDYALLENVDSKTPAAPRPTTPVKK
jgi:hypothetical protein